MDTMPASPSASARARAWGLGVVVGMLASFGLSSGAVQASEPSVLGWRQDMLVRVNAVRAAAGVPPVRACAALRRSAQSYAGLMASTDSFGHIGPDGSQPWDRMRSQGYTYRTAAENIAAGQGSVDQVMREWIASPAHYANLVNPLFRHVGFGHAGDASSTYRGYWVQDFARGGGC
jgi:uncharacterized protein YkwD